MPELDILGEDWENKPIADISGGLVLNQNSESMRSNQFLSLSGVIYRKGNMQKDTGYVDFADVPSGVPGIFRKEFKHISATGTANTFAISDLSFYVLANSGANWHIVSSGVTTTIDANISGGNTVIPVAVTTGLVVNDIIGIELDDGSHHVSTIASVSVGISVTIDDVLPGSGVVGTSGNSVTEGILLAGTADKHVFALTIPWNDALVFTNGIDIVQYYDPSTTIVQVVPNLPSGGDTICEGLALFDTSLILLRTTEGGTNFNQRLRWCDKADFTNWITGDSGSVDLLDSSDNIQNGLILGPYLIIYRQKSIYRGTAVNTTSKRFQWDRTISAYGTLSSASVVDIGDKHLVVGKKQVYLYGGGFDIAPIGDPIKDLLYGPEAELDIAQAHKTFCIYLEARNDVLVFYQTGSATVLPNKTLRWFGDLNTWAAREFEQEILGFGEATKSNSLTWDDLVGSWDDQTWNWNTSGIVSDLETILLCPADGQVVEYSYQAADDGGIAQSYVVETPDFSHQNGVLRLDYIELKCSGSTILIEVSLDEGNTWLTMDILSPGATLQKVRAFRQVSSRTIRFRFSGSSNFTLSWFNLRITLETEN